VSSVTGKKRKKETQAKVRELAPRYSAQQDGGQSQLLDFERLEVYERAMTLVENVFRASRKWRRDAKDSVGDQLRRAAVSIVANVAEGSGKLPGMSKVQYYGYALNSARESLALIEVGARLQELGTDEHQQLRALCVRVCQMLGALQRSARQRASITRPQP